MPGMPELSLNSAVPLLAVNAGRIASLGPERLASAIEKQPITGHVAITRLGLAGDEQADRQHHGGPDKALHHYPAQHYAAWREELPERAALFALGGFGENLAALGPGEHDVCLGDAFRLGSAIVQVSQGRQPCAKLNLRFGIPDMVGRVLESGRTGWYYRVLKEGEVGPGDNLVLAQRPLPDWPLTRLWQQLFAPPVDRAALQFLAAQPLLSASWRERAARRLDSR